MRNLLEVREYKFEHVTIWARLDRRAKTLSFVEWNDDKQEYVDTRWLFAGRELNYMNGWLHVLQAIQYVIDDCKKAMEAWDNEETEKMIALLDAVGKKRHE